MLRAHNLLSGKRTVHERRSRYDESAHDEIMVTLRGRGWDRRVELVRLRHRRQALVDHAVTLEAAVDGAFHAALADVDDSEGADRAREIITRTVGDGFVQQSSTRALIADGRPAVEVALTVTLPLVGLAGIPEGWEVRAHAPAETFD